VGDKPKRKKKLSKRAEQKRIAATPAFNKNAAFSAKRKKISRCWALLESGEKARKTNIGRRKAGQNLKGRGRQVQGEGSHPGTGRQQTRGKKRGEISPGGGGGKKGDTSEPVRKNRTSPCSLKKEGRKTTPGGGEKTNGAKKKGRGKSFEKKKKRGPG